MISIIIPIFNAAPYLKQCLDSILAQTVSDWEAILMDDASTDDSAEIAEEYCLKDSRFRLLRQENNCGSSATRNRGLDEAKGEYIAFMDSDDWWDKDFLEKHLSAIDGYDAVQSGYRRIKDGKPVSSKVPLHRWQFTTVWTKLYRREAIKGLRFSEGHRYEDVLWTVDFLQSSPRIRLLRYIGYNYRMNPESITSVLHEDDMHYVMTRLRSRVMSPLVLYTRMKMLLHFKKLF